MTNNTVNKELLVLLRKKTFAGFSDCKKALLETNNDLNEAITWLRKNGIAKASSKFSDKSANEGKVLAVKDAEGAVILELNSETDFTAKSAPFVKLCEDICAITLKQKVNCLDSIKEMKLDTGHTIGSEILSLSSITGEKIDLKRINYISCDKDSYRAVFIHHTGKIATLLKLKKQFKDDEIKGLAVHVAVNNPLFICSDCVNEDWLQSEKTVIEGLFKKDEKNADMYDQIVERKLQKIIADNCLLTQPYLYDSKLTVQNILDKLETTVENVIYFEIGKN